MKRLLIGLLILLALWLIADFCFGLRASKRATDWEKEIRRDEQGLRVGCTPYASGPDDSEIACLLVHGFADSPLLWKDLGPVLTRAGHRIQAIGLPGFNRPLEVMKKTTAADWQNEVERAYRELAQDGKPVWIIAHSLGCAITLNLTASKRIQPAGLVLLAPLIEVGNERSPVLTAKTWFQVGSALLHFTDIIESIYAPDVHDPERINELPRDVFIPRNIHAALFEVISGLPSRASKISAPMLMVVSPDDLVVDPTASISFFEQAGTPADARQLMTTRDAGHVIPIDYGWEEVALAIVRFIQDGPSPPVGPNLFDHTVVETEPEPADL